MKKLSLLGLAFIAFVVTGCQLYFGDEKGAGDGACMSDGYYVNGKFVSAQCPNGGNTCASDKDCASGCDCDLATKTCVETGFCSDSKDCPTNYSCDTRSTCVPIKASCNAPLAPTCTNGAPMCPQGSVPLIDTTKGCYFDKDGDGQFDCSAINQCTGAPECKAYQYAADCSAATACLTVMRGEGCQMPGGAACQDGVPGCVCARYTFERCDTKM